MLSGWRVLREERSFSYLLSASFISGLGDWFNSVAVLGLLLNLTASGVPIAVTLALRSVPYLLLGPLAGVLADKWNRKWILVLSDLARSVLAFLILATVGAGAANVSLNTLLMQSVARQFHGRVFALSGTTSSIMLSLSMLVTGVVSAHLSLRLLGLYGGLLLMVSTLISSAFLSPRNSPGKGETVVP